MLTPIATWPCHPGGVPRAAALRQGSIVPYNAACGIVRILSGWARHGRDWRYEEQANQVDEQVEKYETSQLNRRPFAVFVEDSRKHSATNLDDIYTMEREEQRTTVDVILVDSGERKGRCYI